MWDKHRIKFKYFENKVVIFHEEYNKPQSKLNNI